MNIADGGEDYLNEEKKQGKSKIIGDAPSCIHAAQREAWSGKCRLTNKADWEP